jgi:hypothetical protein
MTARLLDRATTLTSITQPSARPTSMPDPGYEALSRLSHLRDRLVAALAAGKPGRWKEPPVFFFDPRRQAEFEAVWRSSPDDPFADVSTAIADELPTLFASVEVRRVARAINGLRNVAAAIAPMCRAARDLADLLAIPDDEVVVVLHPARRAGFRLAIRGVADVGQFHILMVDALSGDSASGLLAERPFATRFTAACRDVNPATPAGVPMVASARFHLYTPAALQPDGTLPPGMGGCQHWLWPTMPLASVPRVHGERIVLIGPPAFAMTWDVSRRFPAVAAETRLVETLSPFRVAERLARLTGHPVAPTPQREVVPALSKAA